MNHLLVICPLQSELKHFLDGIKSIGLEVEPRSDLKVPTFHVPSKKIIVALGGHGKVQFGVQTQYLISKHESISGVICIGAGGGLASHLKVGDIIIAEKTIEHDYTEKFDPNAKVPEFHGHPELLDRFKSLSPHDFPIHFGAVASGDEDIVDALRAAELFENTGALAVAWEGTGGAKACKFNNVPFLEIRVITDNARESVPESFTRNLAPCMRSVAHFLCQVV